MNKSDLTTNELLMLQSELNLSEKSVALAYIMLLGGHLGVHRFYIKRFLSGSIQLALFIFFFISYIFLIASAEIQAKDNVFNGNIWVPIVLLAIFGLPLLVWVIMDACSIGRYVREWNSEVEKKIITEIISFR